MRISQPCLCAVDEKGKRGRLKQGDRVHRKSDSPLRADLFAEMDLGNQYGGGSGCRHCISCMIGFPRSAVAAPAFLTSFSTSSLMRITRIVKHFLPLFRDFFTTIRNAIRVDPMEIRPSIRMNGVPSSVEQHRRRCCSSRSKPRPDQGFCLPNGGCPHRRKSLLPSDRLGG